MFKDDPTWPFGRLRKPAKPAPRYPADMPAAPFICPQI